MNPDQLLALVKLAADYYRALEELTAAQQQCATLNAKNKELEAELALLKKPAG